MQARDFENFHKNQKIFKIPKIAKIISKRIQMCFERACFAANFSNKNFCPVFHGGSSLLNFENSRKSLKIPNMPKIFPKIVQMCFEHVLGRFFWEVLAQLAMEGRVFENFQKEIIQKSKKAENCPQKCPNVFWTYFGANFSKNFCPVFHGGSSFRKLSKKTKNFQSSKKAENRYQKYPNVFWTYFGVNFSKKFCPVSHGRSSVRKFSKKTKNFQSSKKPKIVTKSVQTCFEHVSGQTFQKIFCPVFHAGSRLRKFS